jgi:hypothetical protein
MGPTTVVAIVASPFNFPSGPVAIKKQSLNADGRFERTLGNYCFWLKQTRTEVTRRFHNIMSVMGPYRAKSCARPGRESDSCQKSMFLGEPPALHRREVRDLAGPPQEGRDPDRRADLCGKRHAC